MNRRPLLSLRLLGTAFLGAGLAGNAPTSSAQPLPASPGDTRLGRPNVLVLFIDDLNASVQGFGGHPDTLTPNVERLRQRGVSFQNAASNVPVCGPSRASVWSGLYPHTTGFFSQGKEWGHWRKNSVLRNSVTLFEHFRSHGYRIYASGKIHHNGEEDYTIFRNRDGQTGFAVAADFGPMIATDERTPRGLPIMTARSAIQRGGGTTHWDADFGPFLVNPPLPAGTGTWMLQDGTPFHYASEADRDLMPDERAAQQCAAWLRKHRSEEPFLMALGLIRPHAPLIVPESYFERFPLESIRLSPAILADDQNDTGLVHVEGLRGGIKWAEAKYQALYRVGGEDMIKRWTQAYLASVSFMDDRIGEVLDALEASPHADNTIVVFTSDHGYHMGDKNLLHKFTPWEAAVRVPFIVAAPGMARGADCSTPVSLVDIFPTLNELCGLPNDPNGASLPLDGYSMAPLLRDPAAGKWDGPPTSLSVISGALPAKPGEPADARQQHYSLRSATHRYIRWNNGFEELYDHASDPWEWTNLAQTAGTKPILASFRAQLESMLGR